MSPIRLGAPEPVDQQRPQRISADTGFGFEVGSRLPGQLGRTGVITTPHGSIRTPAFVAVGTKATVKAVLPESMAALGAQAVQGVALACGVGLRSAPRGPAGARAGGRHQRDAVHRARGHAQLAAGAQLGDHGVHPLRRADDAIHRAGLDAQRAADTPALVDHRQQARAFAAMRRVQRQRRPAGDGRQALDAFGAAGRAAVDRGLAGGDRFGVAAAIRPTAARALRLRQCRVDRGGIRGGKAAHRPIMPQRARPLRTGTLRCARAGAAWGERTAPSMRGVGRS